MRGRYILTLVLVTAVAVASPRPAAPAAPSPHPSPSPARRAPTSKAKPSPRPAPSPSDSPLKKTFTNEDLEKAGPGKGTVNELPATAEPLPSAVQESAALAASAENAWRQRARAAHSNVRQAETDFAIAQSQLDAITADLDPNHNVLDPNRLQTREAERGKALAAVDSALERVAAARKAVEELEEEARRAGVSRRWLEENP